MHGNTTHIIKLKSFAAAVSEPEAKERGSSLIGRKNFLRNKWNCGRDKIEGARNCGYVQMVELGCAV